MIPGGGMFIFYIAHRRFNIFQFVKMINRFAEKFKITVKQNLREHELLIDGQTVLDLSDLLKIIYKTWSALPRYVIINTG